MITYGGIAMKHAVASLIESGRAVLGIELGSTRIKSVLIDGEGTVLANGVYQWENRLENGIWTYGHGEMIAGLQGSYADLAMQVKRSYGVEIRNLRAIGLSGMMHGYLAFDENWELLTPFRTWRNTVTHEASERLTELFHFHIPQRWSVAHLCQAILNREAHLPHLRHQSTLAGYLHYRLTGENVIGLSEASGMFPIDGDAGQYDTDKVALFEAFCRSQGYAFSIEELYPTPRRAGELAGFLTETGARLLDPSGALCAGVPFCPPEGDGGTGMVASDCIRAGVGSLSMGTSAFAMTVLERPLTGCYRELDVMATPTGKPTVLVHCNNGTGEIDAWV
ncbi:MAG: ATPase, partial [Clostridia bacterium]|nr:ATPase [Clostridia bacterium]